MSAESAGTQFTVSVILNASMIQGLSTVEEMLRFLSMTSIRKMKKQQHI